MRITTSPGIMYKIKEIYYTIQGEGAHTGQPAIFCRFTGCNLWTGREADRHKAVCKFCDTDFVGMDGPNGGQYNAEELAHQLKELWPSPIQPVWVVFTGGEPLLQLDDALIESCHNAGIYIAVETNGTLEAPAGIDWLCVSPKSDSAIIQRSGDELKLVYPQVDCPPEIFENWAFDVFSLQPLDDANTADHVKAAIDYCMAHPKWRLSLQTHKYLGIP